MVGQYESRHSARDRGNPETMKLFTCFSLCPFLPNHFRIKSDFLNRSAEKHMEGKPPVGRVLRSGRNFLLMGNATGHP